MEWALIYLLGDLCLKWGFCIPDCSLKLNDLESEAYPYREANKGNKPPVRPVSAKQCLGKMTRWREPRHGAVKYCLWKYLLYWLPSVKQNRLLDNFCWLHFFEGTSPPRKTTATLSRLYINHWKYDSYIQIGLSLCQRYKYKKELCRAR